MDSFYTQSCHVCGKPATGAIQTYQGTAVVNTAMPPMKPVCDEHNPYAGFPLVLDEAETRAFEEGQAAAAEKNA